MKLRGIVQIDHYAFVDFLFKIRRNFFYMYFQNVSSTVENICIFFILTNVGYFIGSWKLGENAYN